MGVPEPQTVVIAGGGQAGAQAAISLRQAGYEGNLKIFSDENYLPYQRPPLSKAYLKGDFEQERLFLKPPNWYLENYIELELQSKITKIDRGERSVLCQNGSVVTYDALILATGSRPRPLSVSGSDLKNIFDLRQIEDADLIRSNATPGKQLLIVGGGYIGLEAAATAKKLGLEVTIVEMEERVLQRVTAPVISDFFTKVHEKHGVKILTNTRLDHFEGKNGVVSTAIFADGTEIPCDLVLVGIGIIPNTELASESGLSCDNGILVDKDARTDDPRVFAIGDVANRLLIHYGRRGRLESVHNAIEQGKLAAAAILGTPRPTEDCPWFWSDQFNIKLQIVGLSQGYDEYVIRGEEEKNKFAVFYLKNGRLISTDAINAPAEFLVSKKLIISGVNVVSSELEDITIPMKDILGRYTH